MRFENYSREFGKYFECLAFQPRPGQFACTFHDVTARTLAEQERTRLQAQFLQAQKMESLGVLTGGIAHDFNNILTAVVVGAERARSALPSSHAAVAEIDTIAGAAERLAELCRQMLAYAGKSRLVAQPTELSSVVTGMRQLLEVSVSKKSALRFELAEPIPAAEMDATQIRQLILNLVINASDAVDAAGGHIVVRTGFRHFTELELLSSFLPAGEARAAGTYVFLEVEDDGVGMDSETPGPTAGAARTPSSRTARYSGIILLADDDRLVRRVTERQLRTMGFEVVPAADGAEAVDLFRSDPGRVRLCMLDMTMPGLSGSQVAEALLATRADLPIVIFSGYGEEEALALMTRGPRFAFLAKPFTHAELERAIADALGESAGS
jgi:CheY-like chemotaxis protein